MQALYEQYEKDGLVVVGVSIDRKGIDVVKDFVEEMKLTFPNLHDQSGGIALIYRVRGVPTTYILNKEGKAVGTAVGPRPWDSEEAHKLVEQLLAETEASAEMAEEKDSE